ncbi:hypothetical protein [Rhizobium sp. BK376]|jgi:hypothetical protein|uniref:hypothetical protein n=1 Tax=Rhizobium sp. BK376 TaxID=2512149 RepID=UPI001404DBCA|nr:hypothetical protein [Rhizobium sp. BK376]
MTKTEKVIENAMTFIAASQAARQRDIERRAEWQSRIELRGPLLPRPVQLSLDLH